MRHIDDYTEGAIHTIANLIARHNGLPRGRHRQPQPALLLACGENACSKMITVYDDGTQLRERRSLALVTLGKQHEHMVVTPCDNHGGRPFPTSEVIDAALGYEDIGNAEAARRVIQAGYDTSSDARPYVTIAKTLNLVGRTDVDMQRLTGSEV